MQVLRIQGGTALLRNAELELCCYAADMDEYLPLACSVHHDAITGDLLMFVVCKCCMLGCCIMQMLHWPAPFPQLTLLLGVS